LLSLLLSVCCCSYLPTAVNVPPKTNPTQATVRDRYGNVVRDAADMGSNLPSNKAISTTYMYTLLFMGDTR
jgi:hypothetical protein